MKFSIITLFPELFRTFQEESIIGRALREKQAEVNIVGLRDFGLGKHRQVDDTPYGGGEGMLLMPEPIYSCFDYLSQKMFYSDGFPLENNNTKKRRRIFLSPQGKKFTQRTAERLAGYEDIVLLCGRYEGVDQRVRETLIDEEISIGDFVLTGGELPAMVLMDAVIRLLPGVLGKEGSHQFDSFSKAFDGKREYPQYTKPSSFKGMDVPDVLLSGNHAEIEKWRKKHLH